MIAMPFHNSSKDHHHITYMRSLGATHDYIWVKAISFH